MASGHSAWREARDMRTPVGCERLSYSDTTATLGPTPHTPSPHSTGSRGSAQSSIGARRRTRPLAPPTRRQACPRPPHVDAYCVYWVGTTGTVSRTVRSAPPCGPAPMVAWVASCDTTRTPCALTLLWRQAPLHAGTPRCAPRHPCCTPSSARSTPLTCAFTAARSSASAARWVQARVLRSLRVRRR